MLKFLHQDQWFTAVILVLGVLLITLTGALLRFDYVFYDIGQYLSPDDVPDDIVLVVIDEPSLDKLGKWPWTRETHAQLIRQINHSEPKVIGLDVLFSEPDQLHPGDDNALADALAEAKNIVLPIVLESPYPGAAVAQHDSLSLFREYAAGVGRVNVPLDGDGIARGIYLWEGVTKSEKVNWLPHFAQSVLQVAGELPKDIVQDAKQPILDPEQVQQSTYRKIDFSAPSSHFPQISYVDVWSGRVAPSFFDNKIVLIGATAIGMGDFVATPMSSFSSPMAGVEFNANAIAAMRDGKLINDMPMWLNGVIAVLLVFLPVLWLPNQTPFKSLLFISAYMLVVVVLAIVLPTATHLWFKPSPVLMMVLLAYPIWSWRRLERAHAHLNVELQQLKTDLTDFGLQADQVVGTETKSRFSEDLLQSRISQVRYASQLLRDLQHKKNETLAFISHDLRAPLATAMMLLNEPDFSEKKDRVISMLEQANALADNFLSISKAETLNNASFKEVELSGLLQEAVDNIYQMARNKHVKVVLELSDGPAWVSGDFTLLHRACVNLLSNAIKFSDDGGLVEVNLKVDEAFANIEVKDYGEGIPVDKQEQVFMKFKRLEGQPVMQGSGLGLYFVDVTAQKHGGEVTVESELGHWTQFAMCLPVLHFDEEVD